MLSTSKIDPRRYHEVVDAEHGKIAHTPPVCLYLETTNRCNLLCMNVIASAASSDTLSSSSPVSTSSRPFLAFSKVPLVLNKT